MLIINEGIFPADHSDFCEFMKDTSGIKVNMTMNERNVSFDMNASLLWGSSFLLVKEIC